MLAAVLSVVGVASTAASAAPAPSAEQTLTYTVNSYRIVPEVTDARRACYRAEYPDLPAEAPRESFTARYTSWYRALPAGELAAWRATFARCVARTPARHYLARTCVVTYLYPANQVVSRECRAVTR